MDTFKKNIDFVIKIKWALFKVNKKRNTEFNFLKPKQIDCVKKALNNDALVVLPTGYGKSLICELVQLINNSTVTVVII